MNKDFENARTCEGERSSKIQVVFKDEKRAEDYIKTKNFYYDKNNKKWRPNKQGDRANPEYYIVVKKLG